MRISYGIIVFLCFFSFAFSQNLKTIKPENADCKNPIEIKDSIFGPTTPPSGYGNTIEISGKKNSLYEFEQEHNTCWYFFKVPYDALLEMDIVPLNINDDYDFILYKYNNKSFCQDVMEKKIKPIRTCISRNDKKINSKTGLSKTASDEYIHSGPGPSYARALNVKKGEVYYLVVDNVYPNGSGHTIYLHYSSIKNTVPSKSYKTNNNIEANENKNNTKNKSTTPETSTLNINVIDKETRQLIKANIKVFYRNKKNETPLFTCDSSSSCVVSLPLMSSFIITVEANGYFDASKNFKTETTSENTIFNIELDKIKVGQNIVFENILFYSNTANFLPESKPVLENIAATMKRNPKLKIEIHGHVNCPTNWPDCDNMKEHNLQLSINRAKAVYDFLEDAGIDKNRMSFKGFGAEKMIYPDARSEEKMQKNRRVEILIISNE